MDESDWKPLFPKERRREQGGLVVITDGLTPEMIKDRRADNKEMKKSRQNHRRRKKHGRQ